MKRLISILVVAACLGCGEPPTEKDATPASTPASAPAKQPVELPDFAALSRLGVVRRSGTVRVGMNFDDAMNVFAEPPGSYEKSDLPPSIPEPFEARGWQTKSEGFGVILYKGRVAAAVYQLDRTTQERVNELVGQHQSVFGAPSSTVDGKFVHYWFWKSGARDASDQLLMLCATEAQAGKINFTAAVGTGAVMDALGMTADAASRDQVRADRLFDRQRTGSKGNSSNSPNQERS